MEAGLEQNGMGHGRLGADHGRARSEAWSAQDLQQDFKLMHYPTLTLSSRVEDYPTSDLTICQALQRSGQPIKTDNSVD